jgi:hypothetical protein
MSKAVLRRQKSIFSGELFAWKQVVVITYGLFYGWGDKGRARYKSGISTP